MRSLTVVASLARPGGRAPIIWDGRPESARGRRKPCGLVMYQCYSLACSGTGIAKSGTYYWRNVSKQDRCCRRYWTGREHGEDGGVLASTRTRKVTNKWCETEYYFHFRLLGRNRGKRGGGDTGGRGFKRDSARFFCFVLGQPYSGPYRCTAWPGGEPIRCGGA